MRNIFAFLVSFAFLLAGCTPETVISPTYNFSQVNRIGIMAFSNASTSVQGVENLFAKYLMSSGFKVVERAQLEDILEEHNIAVTGYLSPQTTREIGRILGVDLLLVGEVSSYSPARREVKMTSSRKTETTPVMEQQIKKLPDGTYVGYSKPAGTQVSRSMDVRPVEYTINAEVGIIAKLIDVETAEIVWIGSEDASFSSALSAADYIARNLIKSFTKELEKLQRRK